MDTGLPPPSYAPPTAAAIDGLPPAYGAEEGSTTLHTPPQPYPNDPAFDSKVPRMFVLKMTNETEPLVLPSDLRAHLLLLGAFRRLKEEVRTDKANLNRSHLDSADVWDVFLAKAVYRFQCWVQRAVGGEDEEDRGNGRRLTADECPPLDVVMVWHTYMLNPRTYYEDCLRHHRGLMRIGSFPLHLLASLIDPEAHIPYTASLNRQSSFASLTGQPFSYQTFTPFNDDDLVVNCPKCSFPNTIPWVTPDKSGYAQKSFKHSCSQEACSMVFNHEALGVRKFCEDAEGCIANPDKHFLSGTLVDQGSGREEPKLARTLTERFLNPKSDTTALRPEALGESLKWSLAEVETFCRRGYISPHELAYAKADIGVARIIRAYAVPGPFSIELTSAVVRQMSFVEKMYQLGWTEPGRFEGDSATLTRCVIRYHAFLDMMGSTTGNFVVPTLDIDLAWHTHQLLVESYRKLDTLIGLVPDHDDKVEQTALSRAYDNTAKFWKARFGVPYSVCGCLPPSEETSQSFSLSSLMRKGKSKAAASPPIENRRPDLVSVDTTDSAETHPSDHNAITVLDSKKLYVEKEVRRKRELASRAKELEKRVTKGQADGWGHLLQQRECDVHHGMAFLPVADPDSMEDPQKTGQFLADYPTIGSCTVGLGSRVGMCRADFHIPRSGLDPTISRVRGMIPNVTAPGKYGVGSYGVGGAWGGGGCGGGS